ncbi:hypothetical protein C9374_000002 [Naegleria lovaniensis]|uniref:Protein kinase domain-containing protein n=1 Tax=Naegleria lovaniensis TaxID=51637 RepID=A0AA88GY79_NAELO|nr:uncharacterized protein C9374_000002 [Naegleria lovaniensis]KAG2388563.1 hypothetical protein C9374_000002 [Naegleria lovaniensis]
MDLCIEMDLMEYGSLHTMFCRKDSIVPSEEIIWSIISQMINVLSVISKEKIVHRDIKPDNILVKSVNLVSNEIHVCLTDFGLAKDLKCYMNQKSEIKGTMGFIAPEIFDSNNYSTASDIFALGVTIYQLMTGCQNDITALCKQPDALRKDILTNQRVTYSAELIDLVMRMVDTNMSTRITLPEMMK